jgi:hypothetical protein
MPPPPNKISLNLWCTSVKGSNGNANAKDRKNLDAPLLLVSAMFHVVGILNPSFYELAVKHFHAYQKEVY